jgi:hypothetical protein
MSITNLDLVILWSVPLPTRFYPNIRSANSTPIITSSTQTSTQRSAVHSSSLQGARLIGQDSSHELMKTFWMCIDISTFLA